MTQTALPGFSLPPLPEDFSGKIASQNISYPYLVQFDREIFNIRYSHRDDGTLLITAPESFSSQKILRILDRDAEKIIKSGIKERAERQISSNERTIEIHGITLSYSVEFNIRRKQNAICITSEGDLVVQARCDATLEDIRNLIHDQEDRIYCQILSCHPKYKRQNEETSILIGTRQIPVRIIFNQRAKQITIKVHPSHPVQVVAPVNADQGEIHRFIHSNIRWIAEKLTPQSIESGRNDITGEVEINGEIVRYSVHPNPRAKRLILKVRADNAVIVVSPPRVNSALIHQFVREQTDWIRERLNSPKRTGASPRTYIDGDLLPFLGSEYRLAIIRAGFRPQAQVKGTCIEVMIPHSLFGSESAEAVKIGYKVFLEQKMREFSGDLVPVWSAKIGVQVPRVKFANQKTRWGVCTPKGIILNIRLAMAPMAIIEYVIVHELCHLIHHNHSKKFWDLVERMLPDYRSRRGLLKTNGVQFQL